MNDGPVLQFIFHVDIRENRFRSVGYREESPPVTLVPSTISLRDADSDNVTTVTVDLLDILDPGKETITVDEGLAADLGIAVAVVPLSASSFRLILSGINSPDQFKRVINV